jgi:hypothetical protein
VIFLSPSRRMLRRQHVKAGQYLHLSGPFKFIAYRDTDIHRYIANRTEKSIIKCIKNRLQFIIISIINNSIVRILQTPALTTWTINVSTSSYDVSFCRYFLSDMGVDLEELHVRCQSRVKPCQAYCWLTDAQIAGSSLKNWLANIISACRSIYLSFAYLSL